MMPKLRVHAFSISLDGYGAGPDQGLEHPLGVGGEALHRWFVPTRTFQQTVRQGGRHDRRRRRFRGARASTNIGAWILGRNMFGPVRGPWPDESWRGWWGEEPPYHVPGLRPDPSRAAAARDGRRHDLPLRHRRHRGGAGARAGGGRRQRRPRRRRRRDDPAISRRPADRRAARRDLADPARRRRAPVRAGLDSAGARLSGQRARRRRGARPIW